MAPASMQQFLLSFDFSIFISIYGLCLAFFRFLAGKVSFILHALFQLFKIPLDLTLHTHTETHSARAERAAPERSVCFASRRRTEVSLPLLLA